MRIATSLLTFCCQSGLVSTSVVVVEFENLEKAIAAYESDLYRAALKVFNNAVFVSSRLRDRFKAATSRHKCEKQMHSRRSR
jgi:hypothetical protein